MDWTNDELFSMTYTATKLINAEVTIRSEIFPLDAAGNSMARYPTLSDLTDAIIRVMRAHPQEGTAIWFGRDHFGEPWNPCRGFNDGVRILETLCRAGLCCQMRGEDFTVGLGEDEGDDDDDSFTLYIAADPGVVKMIRAYGPLMGEVHHTPGYSLMTNETLTGVLVSHSGWAFDAVSFDHPC